MAIHPARDAGERLVAVDAARGVALVAMMAVHVLPGTGPAGDLALGDAIARGRASAAFAVLAGVALALAHGGDRPLRGRRWAAASCGLAVRCLLIGTLGLALGGLGSGVAVILSYYALLFALAAPLLALGPRVLVLLAVSCGLVTPVISQVLRMDLPPKRGPSPHWSDLSDPGTLLAELAVTGYYPVLVWTTYLCAGLAVGRLGLRSPGVAGRLLLIGGVLALGSVLISRRLVARGIGSGSLPVDADQAVLSGVVPTDSWWWLTVGSPHSGTSFDLAHTTGTALVLLGTMLILAPRMGRLLLPLAWVGSMTLSLYTLHVVVLASGLGPDDAAQVYLSHVVAAFLLAALWRSQAPRGPLEQLFSDVSRSTTLLVGRERGG